MEPEPYGAIGPMMRQSPMLIYMLIQASRQQSLMVLSAL